MAKANEKQQDAQDENMGEGAQDQPVELVKTDENGLLCTYKTDAKGVTHVTITGTYSTTITQEERDGKIIFLSPDFKAPQGDFKSALEWVGRNVGTRTVRAEYDRQNAPLDGAQTSKRASKKQAETEALQRLAEAAEKRAAESEERMARLEMMMGALFKKEGISLDDDDQQPKLRAVGR